MITFQSSAVMDDKILMKSRKQRSALQGNKVDIGEINLRPKIDCSSSEIRTSQFCGNLINAVGEQGNWGESRNPSKMAELLKETSGFL